MKHIGVRHIKVAASRSNMFDPGNMELANMITVKNANSSKVDYNNEGYFMRAQYDYDNKYFASASFRRDASAVSIRSIAGVTSGVLLPHGFSTRKLSLKTRLDQYAET